ncbi:MAG: putative ABC transporter permease protein [Chloroflexi bacterium]|nr:putative ABC transporter permease protein [Chloroflexota bacterium]
MKRAVEKKGVNIALIVALVALPIIALFASLTLGRYEISLGSAFSILTSRILPIEPTWTEIEETVVFQIRLPRVLMAMLAGAGLSIAGASFQGLFQNPLVSPGILGVSAGAGFGAALGILIGGPAAIIQLFAFAFGITAVVGAYMISRTRMGSSLLMLVLAGMIIGAFFTALISLVKYVADPEEQLPTIVFWLMGSMAGASYKDLLWGAPPIFIGSSILLLLRWRINVLSLSEEEAQSLGINVQWLRWIVIIASTMITAAVVSLCGIVGWIGLVIPHVGRMLVGPNHKVLLPACVSIGASYLLLVDNVARAATAAEIPISILTALIGAPFFVYLLRRTGGKWA